MRIIAVLLTGLSVCLGGCANFKAVGDFARATQQVTAPVREEMSFMTATCVQQAGLRSGFELDATFKRIAACHGTDEALQALQRETIDVMDLYAAALLALADDEKFDLSADIEATTAKLAAIRTRSGSGPVSEGQAGALSKILSLIADAWLQKERAQGIRMLVDAGPELAGVGRTLNTFFKSPTGAQAPYARLVRQSQAEADAVSAALQSDIVLRADPIRAAELRLEQWKVHRSLAQRTGPSNVGDRMAGALDAWLESIPVFREQALRPDPLALYEKIRVFRARALEARDAAESSF
jgi:hypothetical protein